MHTNACDPTQATLSAAIPDHESNQFFLLLSNEPYRFGKGERRQDIDPGPCIRLKARLLQAVKLEEVAQFGFTNNVCLLLRPWGGFFQLLATLGEILQQTSKLHREDVLGGGACTQVFQRFEILQGHGFLIDALRNPIDLIQRSRKTLRP